MWVDHTHGLLTDNEMETLDEAARARREAIQARCQAARPGGGPARRPGNAPRRSARRRQRSPDKQASIERRRRLVASGPRWIIRSFTGSQACKWCDAYGRHA